MSNLLLILAVLPGILLMVKVYRADRIEKEPLGLLVLLLLLGAVVCLPVSIVEVVLSNVFTSLIPAGRLLRIVDYFVGVALIEELGKFLVTKICTWKNKNFNYQFDAIVYTVTSALGFAILENIFYVSQGGLQTALLRSVLSVPGHAIFGLFMGVSYGVAKRCELRGDKKGKRRNLFFAILNPTILHGIYDFCLSEGTTSASIVFLIFVLVLYINAWKLLKRKALEDMPLE